MSSLEIMLDKEVYKPGEKVDGKIVIDFWADCGKFGTDEMLDGYVLTPERLLQILQDRDDYTDDEL